MQVFFQNPVLRQDEHLGLRWVIKTANMNLKKLFSLSQVLRACLSYKTAKINCFD